MNGAELLLPLMYLLGMERYSFTFTVSVMSSLQFFWSVREYEC